MTADGTDSEASTSIQLRCTVTSSGVELPFGFQAGFCRVLADQLTRNLDVRFHLVASDSWPDDGKALVVSVRAEAHNRADVTITTGQVAQGKFTSESKNSTTLETVDSGLRPGASTALVRIIGIQIGLIR